MILNFYLKFTTLWMSSLYCVVPGAFVLLLMPACIFSSSFQCSVLIFPALCPFGLTPFSVTYSIIIHPCSCFRLFHLKNHFSCSKKKSFFLLYKDHDSLKLGFSSPKPWLIPLSWVSVGISFLKLMNLNTFLQSVEWTCNIMVSCIFWYLLIPVRKSCGIWMVLLNHSCIHLKMIKEFIFENIWHHIESHCFQHYNLFCCSHSIPYGSKFCEWILFNSRKMENHLLPCTYKIAFFPSCECRLVLAWNFYAYEVYYNYRRPHSVISKCLCKTKQEFRPCGKSFYTKWLVILNHIRWQKLLVLIEYVF